MKGVIQFHCPGFIRKAWQRHAQSAQHARNWEQTVNINDLAQTSAATAADSVSARIEALELAFKWLFDRMANETYAPEQLRYSFSIPTVERSDRWYSDCVPSGAGRKPPVCLASRHWARRPFGRSARKHARRKSQQFRWLVSADIDTLADDLIRDAIRHPPAAGAPRPRGADRRGVEGAGGFHPSAELTAPRS